ncbi:MucBP domain-containing protein, partial [Companilactobacillus sp. FL22-1]|uniref:MucBP domain-containing protein n=1 Tax=Companilactobacillus sp. FL22-1 TaxID=3373892 RepID=UPI003754BED3
MDFKKKRLAKALEDKTYRVKLVHSKKGWLAVGLTFITLFSASVLSTKTVDASAVNNVATANSTTSSYVQLYNSVTSNDMHKANRGLENGTKWKTAKAVKGIDGETYLLVGGNEYANVDQMDLADETSKQSLNGIVHVANGNGQYAELYSNPLNGSKLVVNRALAKNTDWKTDQKVVVNGTAYYRVATNEWVKGSEATLISESSRSDKTYIKNSPDAEIPSTNTNNSGNTNHHNNGGSTTTPAEPDEMGNITINYIKRSTTTNDAWVIKTEIRQVKIGSRVTLIAPKLDGYTVVPGEEDRSYLVQFDGEAFNIPYTQDDATNVVDTSSVTVNYVDEKDNQLAKSETFPVKVGIDFSTPAAYIDGYKLQGSLIQTVKTAKEGNTINFVYSKEDSTTTPTDPETDKTDVTIKAVDENGKAIE